MKIKIINSEKDLLNIDDRAIVHTLIVDATYPEKELVISNFKNLKNIFCSQTQIQKLEINNCQMLEILNVTHNSELFHLEAESATFRTCTFANLPKLKLFSLKDISTLYFDKNNFYSVEISNTSLETLDLNHCLNLSGLILYNNVALKNIYIKDIAKLDCFYTYGNAQFNLLVKHIGAKTRE